MAKNIILVGNSGSGKSSVAPVVARLLGYGLIDIDDCICNEQKQDLATIVAKDGEEHLRHLEERLLEKLVNVKHCVIATGGGLPCYRDNWIRLKHLGLTVWVVAEIDDICQRFMRDRQALANRPLLNLTDNASTDQQILVKLRDRVRKLSECRSEVFKKSDFTVSNSYATAEFCALTIVKLLRQR